MAGLGMRVKKNPPRLVALGTPNGMKTSYAYASLTRLAVVKHCPKEFIDASAIEEPNRSGFIKKLNSN